MGLRIGLELPGLLGDFNVTKCFGECMGPEIHLEGMVDFNDMIQDLSLNKPPNLGVPIHLDQ